MELTDTIGADIGAGADNVATGDAAALHRSLLTLDSHIDIPWPAGPSPFEDGRRCVDLPKMRRGGLRAGCFAAYVPQGPRTPQGHEAAGQRALAMLEAIRAMTAAPPHEPEGTSAHARLAASAAAIEAAWQDGAIAVVPAVENGYAIGEDLSVLARFRACGAVYLTLTHNGHNALADSSNPRADLGDAATLHGGLSPLGREAIAELNRLGMLVDVSHVSKQAMLQAAALSRSPVVATHSCIRALCDHARNLDDAQLDALRACGGVVQITAVPGFLRPQGKPETVTLSDYADHVMYAIRRIGLDHVGLSSDFDGGGGFTGWRHAGESAGLTGALVRRGLGRSELAQLWSGNFLRVLRHAEALAA